MLTKLATYCTTWLASYYALNNYVLKHNNCVLPIVLSTVTATLLYKQIYRYRGSKRRLSLFSQSIVNSFPPRSAVPSTIINGCLYTTTPPDIAEMTKVWDERVIDRYYRFTSAVEKTADGYYVWEELEPKLKKKDKLFVHFVESDYEAHVLATKIISLPFQHQCNPMVYGKHTTQHGKSAAFESHLILNKNLLPKNDKGDVLYDVSLLPEGHVSPPIDDFCAADDYNHINLPKEQITTCQITKANANDPTANTPSTHHIMLSRVDHTIGDGLALFTIFGDMTTNKDGDSLLEVTKRDMDARRVKRRQDIAEANKLSSAKAGAGAADPWGLFQKFVTAPLYKTYQYLTGFLTIASLPAGAYDTAMTYNQVSALDAKKTAVFKNTRNAIIVPTLSLDCIKNIKNAANCTINDVLFCATAGALRRLQMYNQELAAQGDKTISEADVKVKVLPDQDNTPNELLGRALLPIAFPRNTTNAAGQADAPELIQSNKFTFLSADFFMHIADVKARLEKINAMTQYLKTSPDAIVSFAVTKAGTWALPPALAQNSAHDLFTRHSIVFSNVPGPNCDIYMGSTRIKAFHMIYPNIITQVGIISLANNIYMNFTLDSAEVTNGWKLGHLMLDELKFMAKTFDVEWSEPVFDE